MNTLAKVPISHKLETPILLPIVTLQSLLLYWRREEGGALTVSDMDGLLKACLDHYFVDSEGHRLHAFLERYPQCQQASQEIIHELHRLLKVTMGPLMPSYVYRYEVLSEAIQITPTLPTLTYYEQRMADMANSEEGWIPARFR